MIQFTTSKGEFIAIKVVEWITDHKLFYIYKNRLVYEHDDFATVLPEGDFEIIGLSSDILKDEELAKKVVGVYKFEMIANEYFHYRNYLSVSGWYESPCRSIESLFYLNNITGNQLIIKKK